MDIYTKPGKKVKFLNKNGYDWQKEEAAKVLNTEDEYTVVDIDIGGWMSDVYLEGFPHPFNTVMFENVD